MQGYIEIENSPVGEDGKFDLQKQIGQWARELREHPPVGGADPEELILQLKGQIDELVRAGLEEEEAYWIGCKRLGLISFNWGEENGPDDRSLIPVRRSLLILAGVPFYFLCYYLVKSSSDLFFIIIRSFQVEPGTSVNWLLRYFIGTGFVFVLLMISVYRQEQRTINFIDNFRLTAKQVLGLIGTAFVLCITETCLLPVSKRFLGGDSFIQDKFYAIISGFDYLFPLILFSGFIVLFSKYYRKTKF